jgi:hypothetical protein
MKLLRFVTQCRNDNQVMFSIVYIIVCYCYDDIVMIQLHVKHKSGVLFD